MIGNKLDLDHKCVVPIPCPLGVLSVRRACAWMPRRLEIPPRQAHREGEVGLPANRSCVQCMEAMFTVQAARRRQWLVDRMRRTGGWCRQRRGRTLRRSTASSFWRRPRRQRTMWRRLVAHTYIDDSLHPFASQARPCERCEHCGRLEVWAPSSIPDHLLTTPRPCFLACRRSCERHRAYTRTSKMGATTSRTRPAGLRLA